MIDRLLSLIVRWQISNRRVHIMFWQLHVLQQVGLLRLHGPTIANMLSVERDSL